MWEILIADLLLIVLVGAALALMKHPDGLLTGKDWALCSLGVYLVSRGVLLVIVVRDRAILRGLLGIDVKTPDDVSWASSLGLGALAVAMWQRRSHRNAKAAVTQTEEREAEGRGPARPVAPAVLSVDDLLLRAEQNTHRRRSALPMNNANERFEYAVWNCDSALLSYLERVALLHRAKKDKVAARAELTAALPFLEHIDDAIAKWNAGGGSWGFINAGNLAHALLTTLLANDWPRSERLVHAVQLPRLQKEGRESGRRNLLEEVASMLAAVVIEDRPWFDALRGRFHNDREYSYFDRTYVNYDELMQRIFERDGEGLDAALVKQEESFLARGKDSRLGLPSCLDAGPKFNALVFDVWSVALANLAHKKGVSVTYTSEIIPTVDFLPA